MTVKPGHSLISKEHSAKVKSDFLLWGILKIPVYFLHDARIEGEKVCSLSNICHFGIPPGFLANERFSMQGDAREKSASKPMNKCACTS